jgi:menaquinol-cytochrome c reductase iron-sulfur subunit
MEREEASSVSETLSEEQVSATEHPENNEQRGDGRRSFLKVAIGTLSALGGLVLGLPLLGTMLARPAARKAGWTRVADLASLPLGRPVNIRFTVTKRDAFLREEVLHAVWVMKRSPHDISVLSPVCPHLGCYFTWNPGTGRFQCPCHASVFAEDGTVLSGPAPRPLDTLPSKTEGGSLFVWWESYKPGRTEKVPV